MLSSVRGIVICRLYPKVNIRNEFSATRDGIYIRDFNSKFETNPLQTVSTIKKILNRDNILPYRTLNIKL